MLDSIEHHFDRAREGLAGGSRNFAAHGAGIREALLRH
jgi:hypothetical protein